MSLDDDDATTATPTTSTNLYCTALRGECVEALWGEDMSGTVFASPGWTKPAGPDVGASDNPSQGILQDRD